jgi:hypothetical protein
MKNEELKAFIKETFDKRYDEHTEAIKDIREDIGDIKIEIVKIVTAYKVFIAIGSAVGVVIGFCTELFIRST